MSVIRAILAVIAAYITIGLIIFGGFTLFYMVIGTDGAYQPGSYAVSTTWILGTIPVSIAAALAGGWVCRKIAKGRKAVIALVAVIALLGAAEFVVQLGRASDPIPERTGDVPVFKAASESRQPVWLAGLNVLIGIVGAGVGGRALKSSESEPAS
ncbi:MAG: hypothetical protein AAGI53_16995 [Planctomycetota bacterium]